MEEIKWILKNGLLMFFGFLIGALIIMLNSVPTSTMVELGCGSYDPVTGDLEYHKKQ